MGFEIKANTINQIPKGITIFKENEPALYVCVLVKGSILVKNDFAKMILPAFHLNRTQHRQNKQYRKQYHQRG